MPHIVRSDRDGTTVPCDALVIGATAGSDGIALTTGGRAVDAALDGLVLEYLGSAGFTAKPGELEVLPTAGRLPCGVVAVAGLGPASEVDGARLRAAAGGAARRLSQRATIAVLLHEARDGEHALQATVEGLLLGQYRFTKYKSSGRAARTETFSIVGDAPDAVLERAQIVAEAVGLARDLTNEPASTLGPDALATRAREIAEVAGLSCEVRDEDALSSGGFGGILGVGQGSGRPPRLIQLHHAPASPRGKVALVGKGITFDSGGLSIKDAKSMETMKSDMAGAAAVLATMSALPRLGFQVEVLGLIPAAENMTGSRALKPGDVLVHRGGRTTEVNNTDAEGRLVLGDALAFACEQGVDAVVDAATLTGGVMVALGRRSTGLFANTEALARELEDAAEAAGEPAWRLPLDHDLRGELDSDVADMKNSGGRFGSAIIAAMFLQEFISPGTSWGHLDIAGSARSEADAGELSKGGTGVAVRTFIAWLEGRAR